MGGAGWQSALNVLRPLEAQLDAALASGDLASAARMAFGGASQVATLLSDPFSRVGQATVHGIFVELAPLPLDTLEDGTLVDNGEYVSLGYRSWEVTPQQAELMLDRWGNTGSWAVDSS